MKLTGHTFDEPAIEYCILPKGEVTVVFKCGPVLDYDDFDKLCPIPKPPTLIKKGGIRELDIKDNSYLDQISLRGDRRVQYIVLKSLEYTKGLDWETVDMDNPSTWGNFHKELQDAYFTETDINRIQNACFAANSLSELKVEEARANFFAGLEAEKAEASSGPTPEQETTSSGEAASV